VWNYRAGRLLPSYCSSYFFTAFARAFLISGVDAAATLRELVRGQGGFQQVLDFQGMAMGLVKEQVAARVGRRHEVVRELFFLVREPLPDFAARGAALDADGLRDGCGRDLRLIGLGSGAREGDKDEPHDALFHERSSVSSVPA
jgi:hypothetical protein